MILDAHFHPLSCIARDPNSESNNRQTSKIKGVGASACPQEWETLRQWSASRNMPFILGIHPWSAENLAADPQRETKFGNYLAYLESLLRLSPRPCAIGEIGFDKVHSQHPNFTWQKKLFTAQYQLAYKYSLPVVIHCVKSYSHLFDSISELNQQLKQPLPQGLIHAFWASPELAARLIKMNFHISLNSKFVLKAATSENSLESYKLANLAKVIPLPKLLLESDAPWGVNCPDEILKYCHYLAPYWSVETLQLQKTCQKNLHSFYKLTDNLD